MNQRIDPSMFIAIGYVFLCACVLGAYASHGGQLGVLWQPSEIVIILGAAIGAFIASNTTKILKATLAGLGAAFKGAKQNKKRYMALMALLYTTLTKVRKEGLMSIEKDIEDPHSSSLFSQYPEVANDHHLMEFITDYLRLMVSGNLNPLEIESLMDQEIDTHHHEAEGPSGAVQNLADGLPAFGIVAAVMGVVQVMGSVGAPPAVLGKMIGAALVGTFLGILFAYGFIGPLARIMGQQVEESTKEFVCVKTVLLASLQGYAPALAVEFGRKVLYSPDRPTFAELEAHVKGSK